MAGLTTALTEAGRCFDRVRAARSGLHVNQEGGDPSHHGHEGLMVRHLAHYVAAAELAQPLGLHGPLVDVGSGVGAFGAWTAARLGVPLRLVDHDAGVRAVAARAFPEAHVHASLDHVPRGEATLVTAMEVLEHLRPVDHGGFLRSVLALLAPGGLLVLSTPDESGYPGGWSGYAPHIGPVDFPTVEALLAEAVEAQWPQEPSAGTATVVVWRMEGPGYELTAAGRLVQPVVNRAWGALARRAPALTDRLVSTAGTLAGMLPRRPPTVREGEIRVTKDAQGSGTGLLAAVRR